MKNKYIVLTTINSPTKATLKFSKMEGWKLIVVGDIKTPHDEYKKIDCVYLHPEYQEKTYKVLSDAIGWKSIQRRNIGFIEAWKRGADVVATVDDDNIPYENWGDNLVVGKNISVTRYEPANTVFDPLSVTNNKIMWHRGYPIELVYNKNEILGSYIDTITPLIQANLWDGDPDIDAIYRIPHRPEVSFDVKDFYSSTKIAPFNSQNTFIHREVLPYYAVIPHIGRMDDIWGGYFAQKQFSNSLVFGEPTVYQARNQQDLSKNLKDEILGYSTTMKLVNHLFYDGETEEVFERCKKFLEIYNSCFT